MSVNSPAAPKTLDTGARKNDNCIHPVGDPREQHGVGVSGYEERM
jgi:hypothetical protein